MLAGLRGDRKRLSGYSGAETGGGRTANSWFDQRIRPFAAPRSSTLDLRAEPRFALECSPSGLTWENGRVITLAKRVQAQRITALRRDDVESVAGYASPERSVDRDERTSRVEPILVGQGHGILAQHSIDLALHLLDLAVGSGLEPERQVRIRVRGAHEAPAPARKDHARAVGFDRVVPPLELAGDLLDDPELLAVRTRRLELGREIGRAHV